MSTANQAELERLASRIALLVGDDGEAEAAGRAVGVMARRLGLSGGHMKAIFLAGAGQLAAAGRQAAEQAARADRLAGEAHGLSRSLEQLEIALAAANRDRERLRDQVAALQGRLERVRSGRQLRMILGGLAVVAVLAGGAWAYVEGVGQPGGAPGSPAARAEAALGPHAAIVRPAGTTVYAAADLTAPVQARLPGGTRLPVRQLVWQNFTQWAETKLGDQVGYVPVTDLDLDQ